MDVAKRKIARSTTFIGKLDSPQNVEVRARVEAFVEKILFTEGGEVKEGDLLFQLNKQPYEEKLAAAKGAAAEAKAALEKTKHDVDRLTPLAAQNAVPRKDLDAAISATEMNQANLETAEARVKSAELDLGYCDVKAPIAGRIGAKEVSIGSLVGKGAPTLLATISQTDLIWFYCYDQRSGLSWRRNAWPREAGRKMGDVPGAFDSRLMARSIPSPASGSSSTGSSMRPRRQSGRGRSFPILAEFCVRECLRASVSVCPLKKATFWCRSVR